MSRIALLIACTGLSLSLLGAPAFASPTATPAPAAPPAAAAPLTAETAVDNVQKFYAGIDHVTATFAQNVTNSTFGTTKPSKGTVWMAKPGKMRFDYDETTGGKTLVKKTFLSNGTTLYMIEHDNKQVVEKNLQADLMPVTLTFLLGKGDLKKEFNAALNPTLDPKLGLANTPDLVIGLTPKQPSAQYKQLVLVVNKTDFHVKQSIIIDSSANINQFAFYAPDFKKPIDAHWFEFDPKSVPSYRVINANQPAGPAAGSAAGPAPTAPAPAATK
jgi:outer membrane lipoprotein carrier protein